MQPFAGPRPAVVRVAAVAAVALATPLAAFAVLVAPAGVREIPNMENLAAEVGYLATLSLFALIGAASLVHGARHLWRGEPAALRRAAIATGATLVAVAIVFALSSAADDGVPRSASVGVMIGLSTLFFGLAWLPGVGAGRAWLAAHHTPAAPTS